MLDTGPWMMANKRRAKGEGSVIQRRDGTWAYVADLGRDPKTGKRRRRFVYARTRTDLQRKVFDLRAKGGGSIRPRAPGTVGEWVKRWLEHDVRPNRSANSVHQAKSSKFSQDLQKVPRGCYRSRRGTQAKNRTFRTPSNARAKVKQSQAGRARTPR